MREQESKMLATDPFCGMAVDEGTARRKDLKAVEAYKEDELAKFVSTMGDAEKAKTELAKLKF